MDTEHLKEFLVMCEHCNYSAAANALFISQPTLYKHMKSLEAEVGVPLFDKYGNRTKLSQYGKMLIPYAKMMLENQQQYLKEVEIAVTENANSLRIATNYRIKELTREFFTEHRQYKIHTLSRPTLEDAFSNPDCELAFVCCESTPDNRYEYIKYCDEEIVVVVNAAHPLAHRLSVHIDELRNEDFVALTSDSYQFTSPSFLFSKVFDCFQPKVVMDTGYGSEAAQLVSRGIGISLLFRKTFDVMSTDNLALISLNPPVYCPVYLCWKKGHELSAGAKKFVEFIQIRADALLGKAK